ncbi:MAG TPA: VCBS repeat-containing protein, partial [Pyrinomonadaceae bacterium]|nr:VCBS repeat-containing protein [Pyrinomonadaceae bacterium]
MRNLRVAVAVAAMLMALSGNWIPWGTAQTTAPNNIAPNSASPKNKGPGAKPGVAAQKPGAKTPATNPPLFVEVTHAAGIDFRLTCGGQEKLYIVETQCGGAAAFDYDNDGWMDILLVDGSTVADYRAGKCHPPRLYHNNHDGMFTDVSAKSGLNFCGWGYGVAVGDYDNDGWEDVYITGFHGSALYRNNHDGTFTDVTAKAGVANADRWGTSAAFGDYDNDGNLDLYVANYVDLD